MVHVRGARSDYAEWVRLGAEGWGWDDVLPVFPRMEDFDDGVSELHGVGGPTSIVSRYALAPVPEAIIAAAQEVGIARNDDYNSGKLDGVAQAQLTIRDGRRDSAAAAYVRPVINAPNLRVVTRATARRLLVEGTRCVGVEWEHSGRLHTARARSEVVVSAGAIASPKLLLLSGIGPGPELVTHGIDVVLDLPGVGRNLHDHLLSPSIHAAGRTIDPPAPACRRSRRTCGGAAARTCRGPTRSRSTSASRSTSRGWKARRTVSPCWAGWSAPRAAARSGSAVPTRTTRC